MRSCHLLPSHLCTTVSSNPCNSCVKDELNFLWCNWCFSNLTEVRGVEALMIVVKSSRGAMRSLHFTLVQISLHSKGLSRNKRINKSNFQVSLSYLALCSCDWATHWIQNPLIRWSTVIPGQRQLDLTSMETASQHSWWAQPCLKGTQSHWMR